MSTNIIKRSFGNPLVHRSPFSRIFDDIFDDLFKETIPRKREYSPPVDLTETDAAYKLQMEIPGTKKEDIDISIQDGTLTISGSKKSSEVGEGLYKRTEIFYGAFQRSFYLPDSISSSKITAKSEDGILTIIIPKSAQKKSKKIEVT